MSNTVQDMVTPGDVMATYETLQRRLLFVSRCLHASGLPALTPRQMARVRFRFDAQDEGRDRRLGLLVTGPLAERPVLLEAVGFGAGDNVDQLGVALWLVREENGTFALPGTEPAAVLGSCDDAVVATFKLMFAQAATFTDVSVDALVPLVEEFEESLRKVLAVRDEVDPAGATQLN